MNFDRYKLNIIAIGLLLLCAVNNLYSQTFNKRILFMEDSPAMDFANVIIKEDTIITIGRASIPLSPYWAKLTISKFNFEGEVIDWFIDYGPDTLMEFVTYYGRAIYERGDKMLVLGGAGDYFADDFGFAAIVDQHSRVDWIKIYPPSVDCVAYRFVNGLILKNNDLLMLADKQTAGNPEDYPISTVLVYADSLGNVLWEREYEREDSFVKAGSIMADTDSTFLIGFRATKNLEGVGTVTNQSGIIRINRAGDILHEWQNDNLRTYSPRKILRTPDGGFVFVSKYFKEKSDAGNFLFQGYICKLDNQLNKEWELKLGRRTVWTHFNSMIQTYDDKFIAVGTVSDTFGSPDTWRLRGWLVKFDEDGNIAWEQKIISDPDIYGFSELSDITETADHDLVACGLSQSFTGDYPMQGWLLKLDEYGCLDPNWCDTTIAVTDPPPERDGIRIAPNPAASFFKIGMENEDERIWRVQMFDLLGKNVMNKEYHGQNSVEIGIDDWMKGLYFVVVSATLNHQTTRKRWVEKVMIE